MPTTRMVGGTSWTAAGALLDSCVVHPIAPTNSAPATAAALRIATSAHYDADVAVNNPGFVSAGLGGVKVAAPLALLYPQ
jgi:hypothetical protein